MYSPALRSMNYWLWPSSLGVHAFTSGGQNLAPWPVHKFCNMFSLTAHANMNATPLLLREGPASLPVLDSCMTMIRQSSVRMYLDPVIVPLPNHSSCSHARWIAMTSSMYLSYVVDCYCDVSCTSSTAQMLVGTAPGLLASGPASQVVQ
mmetsp:Transcript_48366/g.90582  ORF Transcript_48366/g.90582 Transcript_48366/m.90582 type:complete len:149 (-) Transcript_48366:1764-2210(-)